MSLINQLLQDLDKRRSQPAEDVQLPQGTRATPVSAPTRMTSPAVWLLAVLGCGFVVAALYVWQARSLPTSYTDGLLATVRDHPTVADKNTVIPAITQAQVEATLMAPVFQLSNELTSPPAVSRVALNVDSAVAPLRKKPARTPQQRRNGPSSKRIATVSAPAPEPQSEPEHTERKQPQTTVEAATASNDAAPSSTPAPRIAKAAKRPQTTVEAATASNDDAPSSTPAPRIAEAAKRPQTTVEAATASNDDAPSSTPSPRIAEAAKRPQTTVEAATASNDDAPSSTPAPRIAKAAKRPVVLRSEALEETEIPAVSAAFPIARKTRQLTSYERAEIEFRKGVANLRQGRLTDAEAFFRLANEEDRSHVAARQALVGILIEVGRNADAEEVLSESLRINPRQPREAMVLARLQVERGDFEAAIRTLERVAAYTGSDAGYMSFLAAVFQRASRHEEAAKQYRNALALMPRNAIWLMGLGISLRALGERDRAMDAFKRAANTGTLSPELQAYVVRQYTELHVAAK